MVKRVRRKSKISYNQPKIFSPGKEKRQRSKINLAPFYKILPAVLAVFFLLYLIFFTDFFKISDVMIEGNQITESEVIKKTLPIGDNIFLLSSSQLQKQILEKIPEIKDARVYKGFPDALKVVVLEYSQSLIWKSNQRFYLVSSEGYIYRDVTDEVDKYSTLPRVEDNSNLNFEQRSKITSAIFVSFVQNIRNNFFSTVNIEPDYFYITESTFDLNLKTKAGFVVKFDTLRSSKKQLEDLKKVLAEKRDQIQEYVDLRVDGWAYYK